MNNQNLLNKKDLSHSIFKYAVLLEYDGRAFAGSQLQPNHRTIQQELETALSIVLKQTIKTVFAGRTDTGVSSLGQVVHFEVNKELDVTKIANSLNGLLPKDISVRSMEAVENSFHARKSALKRWYRFTINNHPYRTALNTRCLHVREKLDEKLIHQALQSLLGTNEFDSFKSSNSDIANTKCTVYKAKCFRDRDFVYIDIVANRYVYNMVRIIVGTVIKIGKKEEPVNHLFEVLQAKDRQQAGKTVKPEGLTLMAIEYPEEYNLFAKDNNYKVIEFILENFMEAQNENILCKAS